MHLKIWQTHKPRFPPSPLPRAPITCSEICLCKLSYFKQIKNCLANFFYFLWKWICTHSVHCVQVRRKKCFGYEFDFFMSLKPEMTFSTLCSSALVLGFKPEEGKRGKGKMRWETRLNELMCLTGNSCNRSGNGGWVGNLLPFCIFLQNLHLIAQHRPGVIYLWWPSTCLLSSLWRLKGTLCFCLFFFWFILTMLYLHVLLCASLRSYKYNFQFILPSW